MARVLITGSADGLGRAAAEDLVGAGHEVIVHARSAERLASIEPIMVLVMGAVVGGMVICLYLPMFTIYQNIQSN